MKKKVAVLLTMFLVLGNSLTVLAAPEAMPDGTVFDAEYYAQNNPDIETALGKDVNVLYQHYVAFGKAEGRKGLAGDSTTVNTNKSGAPYNFNAPPYTALDFEREKVSDGIVPLYDGFGWMETKWRTLSGAQKIEYLVTMAALGEEELGGIDVDADALEWWVNTSYDDMTKYNYLAGIPSTCTASSVWVICASIPQELKIRYFRQHDLRYNSPEVHRWWFDNVGNPLTTEETAWQDARNYEWYRRTSNNSTSTTEIVHVGDKRYYISKEDLDRAISEGKIEVEEWMHYMMDSPNGFVMNHYYAKSTDIGCKLWSVNYE